MRIVPLLLGLILSFGLVSCGGGSGDSGDATLSTNACDTLGLPTRVINGTSCGSPQRSAVVRLLTVYESGQIGTCTATMIQPTIALTAAHCLVNFDLTTFPSPM